MARAPRTSLSALGLWLALCTSAHGQQDGPKAGGEPQAASPEAEQSPQPLPEPTSYIPLNAELLLQARPAEGMLILDSGYRNHPYFDADAVVWLGAGDVSGSDLLSASIGFRDPYGISSGRAGRFLLSAGAVRPVQLDGGSVTLRTPTGTTAQFFGGAPVVPEFGERDHDWMVGGRVGQWLWEDQVGVGLSYVHRRDAGMLAYEELGGDMSVRPLDWLEFSLLGGVNLTRNELADGRLSVTAQHRTVHTELFASRRVAALLLPATSLFSVVSNTPTSEVGTELSWFAFPRLDLGATVAAAGVDDDWGYRVTVRSVLRLDDEGEGDIRLELNRRDVNGAAWTGGRIAARIPITPRLTSSASLELVGADEAGDKGSLWPWMRLGAVYSLADAWRVAAAIETRAGPEYSQELNAMARLSYSAQVVP